MNISRRFIISFILILLTISGCALFDNDVDKAKKFMSAGMYPQAITLLEKRIHEKPTDAEAHFQLAICYIKQGKYIDAKERFNSAVNLKAAYGYNIGTELHKTAKEELDNKQIDKARRLFFMAIEYQPNLKEEISREVFTKGKILFDQHRYNEADLIFPLAVSFDNNLSRRICDMYYKLGQTVIENESLIFYRKTANYCSAHNVMIGKRLLAIAQNKTTPNESQKWRKEASKYITVTPDKIVYKPGKYSFILKAGEVTDHWIQIASGCSWDLRSSKDHDWDMILADGRKSKFRIGQPSIYQRFKEQDIVFKIQVIRPPEGLDEVLFTLIISKS